MLRFLYEMGIGPHQQNAALYVATRANQPQAVKLLLDKGILPKNEFLESQWAFSYACQRGYVEVVKLLLEAGMTPDAKSQEDRLALQEAARAGQTETVKLLLDSNADKNAVDWAG